MVNALLFDANEKLTLFAVGIRLRGVLLVGK